MTALTKRLLVVGAVVALLALTPSAAAHSGGRAVPAASVLVRQSGPLRALVDIRIRDQDGDRPIRGAEVEGFGVMTRPHTMYTHFEALPELASGRYRAAVLLPMAARWTLVLKITGRDVVARELRAPILIERRAGAAPPRPQATPLLLGSVRYSVGRRDLVDMAVLWTHGVAATGWIVGIALLVLATTAGSGTFASGARRRIGRWYRRRGFALLILAAALVVATGTYNTLRVTPFGIVWRPGRLDELDDIPYGRLYEGILLAKLLLFLLMLVAGAAVAWRARRAWDGTWDDSAGVDRPLRGLVLRRLGSSGVVFLLTAPLIVAAAVALRYVHVLSHAASSAG